MYAMNAKLVTLVVACAFIAFGLGNYFGSDDGSTSANSADGASPSAMDIPPEAQAKFLAQVKDVCDPETNSTATDDASCVTSLCGFITDSSVTDSFTPMPCPAESSGGTITFADLLDEAAVTALDDGGCFDGGRDAKGLIPTPSI